MNIYSFNRKRGIVLPRTKEQFEAMRNATRTKIQDAAIYLFTKKGYASTSVQDIADYANISTGLMYRHFRSKDELFIALVSEAAEGLKNTALMLQSEQSPKDLINNFTRVILNDLSGNEGFARFMVLISQSFMMEEFLPQVQNLTEQSRDLMKQMACVIGKGQELGQCKKGNPKEMALCYFATIQGLSEMRFAMKDNFIIPDIQVVNRLLLKEDIYD